MKPFLKNILAYAGIVLLFAVLAYAYCYPVLQGKIVNQSDISGWAGMAQETLQHNKANPDDPTLWSNSMFGGMPNVTFFDKFEGDLTNPLYKFLLLGRRPASYIFIAMLGAFLLMLSLGVDKLIAIGGAIAVAFCSYNMQIIQVGHNTKMQAIAFFPWVLAGLIYSYRASRCNDTSSVISKGNWKEWLPKTILGSVLFGLALSFQIKANHPQITWYLATVVFIYAVSLLIWICLKKDRKSRLGRFFAASTLLLVIGLAGIATNANKLLPTYNYAKFTMRGGSELVNEKEGESQKGLDLEYATAWSYGISETPNLLIPNFNGGASASALSKDSESAKLLKRYGYKGRELNETLKYMPTYWGPQPFTAGPMYMGAVTIFLFVLGCCICSGREKWWMIAASVLALFLAWGSHFMWFTKLCYDSLPMYNKFRTVSMALIVLQCTLPMLGFVALDKIFRQELPRKEAGKKILMAGGITLGLCLALMLIQKAFGSFIGAGDQEVLSEALAKDRAAMLTGDALRSMIFVALAAVTLYFLGTRGDDKGKVKSPVIMAGVIAVLVVLDLFPVDKRYLNSDHFIEKKEFNGQFDKRKVDEVILRDEEPDFRVLDLSVNTFNDSHPSYWHKSVGGYSPTKLQRYQDLIDRYISSEMKQIVNVVNAEGTVQGVEDNFPKTPVLNMLNTKYVIVDGNFPPVENFNRYGNCWFVDDVICANGAEEEIGLLKNTNLRHKAVVRKDIIADISLDSAPQSLMDMSDIRLTSYKANELRYSYVADRDRLAVFSEIWHPGWKATVNGEPLEILRADWVLRAAVIPQGDGEIVMRYDPDDYHLGRSISQASSILLIILMLLSVAGCILFKSENN